MNEVSVAHRIPVLRDSLIDCDTSVADVCRNSETNLGELAAAIALRAAVAHRLDTLVSRSHGITRCGARLRGGRR